MKTALLLLLFAAPAVADEGMWTFNNFPTAKVREKYNFTPDDKWLENVRMSSARLAGGCSASFVSESGLVMTNHHCAHQCIQQLSTADRDFVKTGFYAKNAADEVKCPEIEINQLAEISDVSDRIFKATKGLEGQKYNETEKAEMSRIEKECQTSDKFRCDVVSLYHGGVYNLYKYRRFQDVRLVFAPEFAIAFFGGDPDNFNFPRYDLDVSFLRVYEDGKPAHMDHHFKWSPAGVKEGDLTFVTGHPGRTSRQLTVAQLEYQRDVALPERLLRLAEARGMANEFQHRGAEQKRIIGDDLFGIENSYKALRGRLEALLDKPFFASKVAEENTLRARVMKDPEKKKKFGPAWDAIAKAQAELKKIHKPLAFIEQGSGFSSDLFTIAKTLVRAGDERPKPNEKRFRELRDSALPEVTQRLFSTRPIYDEKEIAWLSFSLTKLREELGADDPFVKKVLGKESPEELAARLVKGTKLKDVALRKKLWEGGKAAVDASTDPMIELVEKIDPDARAVRKKFEDEIEPVLKKNDELIAKARFAVNGTGDYPDATFTLRLSYGAVKGWEENGNKIDPLTRFAGLFDRATGRWPFALPESWIAAKPKLELTTPFNFASTNDIIGGNSGSPVVNRDAQVVGLIFDGNLPSLGGEYGFDPSVNRAVAVHSEGLIQALDKVYGARRIVEELRPKSTAAR
jgi:V8-like Glu-specific endopeptidase